MKYDVTIGIPVYNSVPFIIQALKSALVQSYVSIEFLIIDDGSSDGSLDVIKQIVDQHPRKKDVHIISHPVNQGVSVSRNEIIHQALGEFIYFMDSDDEIAPDTIKLLIENIRKYDAEIVFGSYEKKEITGEKITYQYPSIQFDGEDQLACFAYRKFGGIQASACNYLVWTSILRDNNLRFINADYWEDMVFTYELVTYIHKAVLLPDITYYYISRSNSLSQCHQRISVPRDEILKNVATVDCLKHRTSLLYNKVYYPLRCYCVMMMDLYVAIHVLKHREHILPYVSDDDIRQMMSHPAKFSQIIRFHQARFKNLILFILGKLPPSLCVKAIQIAVKLKNSGFYLAIWEKMRIFAHR
jgi:glycosyltransferase involved in cell wall biosynthesis